MFEREILESSAYRWQLSQETKRKAKMSPGRPFRGTGTHSTI